MVDYFAEQLIYSEMKESKTGRDRSAPTLVYMHLYLWVYEADMRTSKTVYRSSMTWPNKQHEDVYICIGMSGRESADTRCLSEDMTVIFTENFSKDHHHTADGTQIKLPIRMFNKFLIQEELEIRTNFCNNACQNKEVWILLGIILGSIFIGMPALLFVLVFTYAFFRDCCCRGKFSKTRRSAALDKPDHGKSLPCSHLTKDLR